MPSGSRTASQTTPARPSISPLSTASKTLKSSPIATRDSTMHDIEAQFNSEMGVDDADADADADVADDRSSSLSEPEDDDDEEVEDANGLEDADEEDEERIRARKELEVDSEAETERLDQTPQKLRKQAEALGRTPSKLSQAATVEDELSEPPSPLPAGAGAASSTSTIATAGQKRKRSDTADSPLTSAESDVEESPRKRSHEMVEETPAEAEEDATEEPDAAESTPLPDTSTVVPAKPRGRKPKRKGPFKKTAQLDPVSLAEDTPGPNESSDPTSDATAKALDPAVALANSEALALYNLAAKQFRAYREQDLSERLAALATDLQALSQPNPTHPEFLRQTAAVDARHSKQLREAEAHYNLRLRSLRQRTLGERSQLFSQYYQTVREVREDALEALGEDWYAIQKERRGADEIVEERYLYKFPVDKKERVRMQRKFNREVEVLSGVAKWVGWPAAPELEAVGEDAKESDLVAMGMSKRSQPPAGPHLARPLPPAAPLSSISSRIPEMTARMTPAPPMYLSGNQNQTPTHNSNAPHTTSIFAQTAHNAHEERIAHEQYLERNAWARPPVQPSLVHHPLSSGHGHGHSGVSASIVGPLGLRMGAHTADWAEPVSAGRGLTREARFGGIAAGSPIGGMGIGRSGVEDGLGSSPAANAAPLPKGRVEDSGGSGVGPNGGGEVGSGWRNFSNLSGASTIDAPGGADGEREGGDWRMQISPTQHHRVPQPRDHQQDYNGTAGARSSDAPSHSPRKPTLPAHSPPGTNAFDPGQLHRRPVEPGRDTYPGIGAFGTPTPGPRGGMLSGGLREGGQAS